jgi:hypothetical protein
MKLSPIIILCLFANIAHAQISDQVAQAIKTLLLDGKISEKIFVEYNQSGGLHELPPGKYAFICPDTTFQKVYLGILRELTYSIKTDSLLYKKTFYRDSTQSIYINGRIGYELWIVFQNISVDENSANISFFTTSFRNEQLFRDKYVDVVGRLVKDESGWRIVKREIKAIEWKSYLR